MATRLVVAIVTAAQLHYYQLHCKSTSSNQSRALSKRETHGILGGFYKILLDQARSEDSSSASERKGVPGLAHLLGIVEARETVSPDTRLPEPP